MSYLKPPPRDGKTPPEQRVHELRAMDLVTGPPEIGQPTLKTIDPREARRAVRTKGGGVGAAIAAASGSASASVNARAEGVSVQAIPPTAAAAGGIGSGPIGSGPISGGPAPLQVHDAVSKTTADSVEITYHPPPVTSAIASSQWTGRLSVPEQVVIVKRFAPLASGVVDELAAAIRAGKGNDPAHADALTTLKELHHVLGELIAQAERGRGMKTLLSKFEGKKAKLRAILADNAALIFLDPVRAVAAAQMLDWVSNFTGAPEVSDKGTLLGLIYCALIGRDVLNRTNR